MPDPTALTMTADILPDNQRPALSATSDMPGANDPPAEPAPEPTPDPQPAPSEPTPEPAPEPTPAEPEPPAPAEPKKAAVRFADLTRERDQARAELDRALTAIERLTATLAQPKTEPEPPPPPAFNEARPRREAFDSPEAYDDALLDWADRRSEARLEARLAKHDSEARAAADRETATRSANEHATEVAKQWQDRVAAFSKDNPEFPQIFERKDIFVSPPMAQALATADNGPEILAYFGEHPEESTRIASLTLPGQVFAAGHQFAGEPVPDIAKQMFEIAKIGAKLSAPPPRPKPSAAPAPITPIVPTTPAGPKSPDEMTTEEYAAATNRHRPSTMSELRALNMAAGRTN